MRLSRQKTKKSSSGSYLDGQLLIAMPAMTDRRFARSVIYMCAHSSEGAMGLIINQRARYIDFPGLLRQLNLAPGEGETAEELEENLSEMQVHVGGPVETGRGFVLHSSDYFAPDSTLEIDEQMCLTATIDILKAIAGGQGPRHAILALGYAGWGAGQLESEIQQNGWLHCTADRELVFETNLTDKYDRALAKLGIDPTHLVSDAGHA
jgi:putative transcriptional regulator